MDAKPRCSTVDHKHLSKSVLLLASYHQGDRWNDSMVRGVREALETHESVSLSIEDLDLRRYTGQDHSRMTTEYMRAKYQGRSQDLVLVSDDQALNFLLAVRDDIFPKTIRIMAVVSDMEAGGRTNLEQYRAAAAGMKGRVQTDELLNMTDKAAPDIRRRGHVLTVY